MSIFLKKAFVLRWRLFLWRWISVICHL